jgi:transposase
LRRARLREGRYLLRTNLSKDDPAKLWDYYIRLVEVEQAFKTLKGDLAVRPVFHQSEVRVEAHIFIAFLIAFLVFSLHATLGQQLRAFAPGLTPRALLDDFAAA